MNAYLEHASGDSAMVLAIPRGSRQRMLVANAKLHRLRGRQGRPKKAAIIGELLWEWFASIRNSIVGRIPSTVVVSKAQQLCEDYVVESLRRGIDPQTPVVDGQWARRWRVDRGVPFRKPIRKWKVPKTSSSRDARSFGRTCSAFAPSPSQNSATTPPCGTSTKARTI